MSSSEHHKPHQPEQEEAQPQTEPQPTTIRAEAREELSSLLQRIKEEPSKHIRLYLPERSIAGQGTVGLKLLADEIENMGKKLEIASDSAQVQSLAQRAGLSLVTGSGTAVVHGFLPGQDVAQDGLPPGVIGPIVPDHPSFDPEPSTPMSGHQFKQASIKDKVAAQKPWQRVHIGKVAAGMLLAVLIILLLGGYMAVKYLPQATIVVYTKERTLDRDLTVTADPSAVQADVATLVVPATTIEAEASKSETFQATGKKDIGEKATGTVTLANYTDTDRTFAAGTRLTSGQYQFVTDSVVTIPAETIDLTEFPNISSPGLEEVAVTAVDIGSEYNLAAKSNFTIDGASTSAISGQNEAAFTGGSKQSVTVISAQDRQQAQASLEEAVKLEAEQALRAKVPPGTMLLEEAMDLQTTQSNFSGNEGDQTNSFTGSIRVSASALTVMETDVEELLNTVVAEKVPDGYTMDESQSTVDLAVLRVNTDGSVELSATLKTLILPVVDTEAMLAAIKGKKPDSVQEYLKGQPNLQGYDIKLSPKLPAPFNTLPSIDSHIQINVEVQK